MATYPLITPYQEILEKEITTPHPKAGTFLSWVFCLAEARRTASSLAPDKRAIGCHGVALGRRRTNASCSLDQCFCCLATFVDALQKLSQGLSGRGNVAPEFHSRVLSSFRFAWEMLFCPSCLVSEVPGAWIPGASGLGGGSSTFTAALNTIYTASEQGKKMQNLLDVISFDQNEIGASLRLPRPRGKKQYMT